MYYYLYYNNGGPHSTKCKNTNSIDIGSGGKSNVVIVAAADGTVTKSLYDTVTGFGNYIAIEHSDGSTTLYCHLKERNVTVGQHVTQGQPIGIMGNTSATKKSIGVHLHFEWNGGDPWSSIYRDKYADKFKISTDVYQANKNKSSISSFSKSLVDWVAQNCILENGYYILNAKISIDSDIPSIQIDESNAFLWSVYGNIQKSDVKWESSNQVTWSFSNSKIVTVNRNGLIKAKSAGNCIIYAKANVLTASCRIHVKSDAELAKAAYTAFQKKHSLSSFLIVDLDKNKIPELLCFDNKSWKALVYTYNVKKKKMILLCSCNSGKGYGSYYNAKNHQVALYNCTTGGVKFSIYKIKGTKATRQTIYKSTRISPGNSSYKKNSKKISSSSWQRETGLCPNKKSWLSPYQFQ